MTICVYYKDVLVADGLVTAATNRISSSYQKIGMIYQDKLTGTRSVDPTLLDFPEEFAMYAISGMVSRVNKFLRWFVNTDHPTIDHEDYTEEDSLPIDLEEEYELHVMVIFKDYDIIRMYNSSYLNHCFIDQSKTGLHAIGCGSLSALAINAYDKEALAVDIVKAVITIDIACGGTILKMSFSDECLYDEKSLKLAFKQFIKDSKKPWWKLC